MKTEHVRRPVSYISWMPLLMAMLNTFAFPSCVRHGYSFSESSRGQSCHMSLFLPELFSQEVLEREICDWTLAEVIIYMCCLILLTAISSRRCQCDMVSSRELHADVAEEPLGWTSRLRLLSCTLLCAYSPLSLASLEPLNFLSWFILHRCFAWIKHLVKVSIFTSMCMLLIWREYYLEKTTLSCCTEYEFY